MLFCERTVRLLPQIVTTGTAILFLHNRIASAVDLAALAGESD